MLCIFFFIRVSFFKNINKIELIYFFYYFIFCFRIVKMKIIVIIYIGIYNKIKIVNNYYVFIFYFIYNFKEFFIKKGCVFIWIIYCD